MFLDLMLCLLTLGALVVSLAGVQQASAVSLRRDSNTFARG